MNKSPSGNIALTDLKKKTKEFNEDLQREARLLDMLNKV